MRFFFAHAHEEHNFVRDVAERVGRPFVILDEYNFESGKTFKTLMVDWLERCDAFVLFASRASLSKPNVLFEIDEAEKHNLAGRLGRILTFVIDEEVPFDSLPKWLQPYNARKTTSPRNCAREILHHIRALRETEGHNLFFGRAKELQHLESVLVPLTDSPPARAFSLFGLPGMGKRTLAVRAGRDILQFDKHLVIPVAVGDSARELARFLEDEVGSQSSDTPPSGAPVSDDDRCVGRLSALIGLGTLPIVHDQGGLLTNDGFLIPALAQIFQRFLTAPSSYLAIASQRKIAGFDEIGFPQVYVVGLQSDDIMRYLAKLASLASIPTTPNKLRLLAEYVAGYPLAAQLATNLAKRQGLEMVLAQKEQLVEFRATTFGRILSSDPRLDFQCRRALAVLWLYGPIPLAAIAAGMRVPIETLATQIQYLFDCALLDFDDRGYWIIEPLYDVVDRLSVNDKIDHSAVAAFLRSAVAESLEETHTLNLRRALYRADLMAGHGISPNAVAFTSDIFALAKRAYDDQRFDTAVNLARQAREYNDDSFEVLQLLAKSYVKSDLWNDAEQIIEEIETRGHIKDAAFLRGFLLRNQGRFSLALKEFLSAWERGMNNVAVHREIAAAAFRDNKLDIAREHITIAEQRVKDNPFIIDLQIQIAVALGDEKTARSRLKRLEIVDDPRHFEHRRSIVEAHFGNKGAALDAAKKAVAGADYAPAAYLVQLARAQIDSKKLLDAAETLRKIERSSRTRDRAGARLLRAAWEVASGNAEQALIQLGTTPFFDSGYWYETRIRALELALEVTKQSDPRRSEWLRELGEHRNRG